MNRNLYHHFWTPILIDGEPAGSLGDFLRDNDEAFDDLEIHTIVMTLLTEGRPYHGGGGAAAEWVIELDPDEERIALVRA